MKVPPLQSKCVCAVLLGMMMVFGVSVLASGGGACCDFNASRNAAWRVSVGASLPAEQGCDWTEPDAGENSLAFADSDRLVAISHAECLSSIGAGVVVGHTLDSARVLDAATGKVLASKSWPDASLAGRGFKVQVFSIRNGQVLVRLGNTLKVLSLDMKELETRSLPTKNARILIGQGRDVGLALWPGDAGEDLTTEHWFRTADLTDTTVESTSGYLAHAITDDTIFYSALRTGSRWKSFPAYIRKRGSTVQPLCEDCWGVPSLLTRNGLVMLERGTKASFALFDPAQNKIVYEGSFGDSVEYIAQRQSASEANRFAFSFGHLSTSPFSDKSVGRIVVFDAGQLKPVVQMKYKEGAAKQGGDIESWPGPVIALSPNGRRLAVLEGTTVQLYEVGALRH